MRDRQEDDRQMDRMRTDGQMQPETVVSTFLLNSFFVHIRYIIERFNLTVIIISNSTTANITILLID